MTTVVKIKAKKQRGGVIIEHKFRLKWLKLCSNISPPQLLFILF